MEVTAYYASRQEFLDDNELPFDWYKNHCVKGAEEFELPKPYVDFLKSFATKTDTNKKRVLEETSIYN
jgi:gamma-glutamylcyclotransferase